MQFDIPQTGPSRSGDCRCAAARRSTHTPASLDGRWFDPATRAARAAIDVFAEFATATVTVGLYKGNIYFQSLTDCAANLYNEADSSMEASEGLNPVSSQGFVEVQSVEALSLACAGQIRDK